MILAIIFIPCMCIGQLAPLLQVWLSDLWHCCQHYHWPSTLFIALNCHFLSCHNIPADYCLFLCLQCDFECIKLLTANQHCHMHAIVCHKFLEPSIFLPTWQCIPLFKPCRFLLHLFICQSNWQTIGIWVGEHVWEGNAWKEGR